MKKAVLSILMASTAAAAMACTSLIATPGASVDASSMVTYAADSHTLYGDLAYTAAADHQSGATRKVYDWDTNKYLGEIAQVPHTYAVMGNMNEHGVTVVESTWGGREELAGSGIIDYGSLIYIALERSKTAREALKTMTDLVAEYGYASEGESFSIADPNEVWVMEMIGKGKEDKGAVWVARRVPDGYISGHANHSRIHQFPLNDPETLYSPDVIDFARKKGYFNGKDKDFDFSRAYAVYDMGALRGCDGRVWSYFNRFADGMDKYLPWITEGKGEALPLWVKPDKKQVSANDLKWMMRDHFEGTPLDMTQDIGAGAYAVPYRWRPLTYEVDGKEYTHERAIATQQTGFSLVSSMNASRPQAMKGIMWYGVDDANTCVYVPIFNSATHAPRQLERGNGDLLNISWDAMFWVNNYVANQAYNRYSQMIPDIRKVQQPLEEKAEAIVASTLPVVQGLKYVHAQSLLQSISDNITAEATTAYKDLGDYLLVKYLDGNRKKEVDGKFAVTPEGVPEYPDFPGYDQRYYRSIASEQGERLEVKEVK